MKRAVLIIAFALAVGALNGMLGCLILLPADVAASPLFAPAFAAVIGAAVGLLVSPFVYIFLRRKPLRPCLLPIAAVTDDANFRIRRDAEPEVIIPRKTLADAWRKPLAW